MNTYKQLKDKHQKEMNAFPLGAAFSNSQFADMMQKWGLTVDDADKICSIGAGCFIRKTDKEAFFNMLKRFKDETNAAIAADTTGDGFIYDMFYYELANLQKYQVQNCITFATNISGSRTAITVNTVNYLNLQTKEQTLKNLQRLFGYAQ